jgi:hypothetical protein
MHLPQTKVAWKAFATRPAPTPEARRVLGNFADSNYSKQWREPVSRSGTTEAAGTPWPVDFDPRAYESPAFVPDRGDSLTGDPTLLTNWPSIRR